MVQDGLLRVRNLKKVFRSGNSDLVLFENLSFQVQTGEMLAIVGESGAGKSTLLHILGVLDTASEGDVYFAQLDLAKLSEEDAAEFRSRELGICLAVPLFAAGVYRRGECCHAAADARLRQAGSRAAGPALVAGGWFSRTVPVIGPASCLVESSSG